MLVHDRGGRQNRARAVVVDRRDAERRVESAGRIDGHAFETDEM